jgi:ankyrin repeat protein
VKTKVSLHTIASIMKSSFISPRRRRKNQRVPSDASTSTAQRGKSKKTSLILVKKKVSDRDLSSSRQKNRAPAVPPSLSTRLTSRREQHRSRRSTANINTPTSMMESSSRRMTNGGGGESKKYQSNDNTASSTRTGFNPFTDPFIDQSTDPLVDPFIDPHNSTKSSAKNHSTSKVTIHDDDRNYAYGQQEIPLENIVVLSTDEILTGDLSVDHNNASFPKMNANDDVEFNSAPSKGLQQQASKEEYSPHLPDNNLHQMIEDNDWEKLDSTLKLISSDQNYLLSEVCAISKVDASVLHACCWKAPVGLTLLIIKLLTINPDNIQNLFLLQDKDGNTPMHLCAANMMPFYDDKSKPIIDASVLDLLIAIVPQALIIQNKEGDTPLHLFVTSKAAAASVLSSFPPTANIAGATTRALSQILKNLSKEQDVIIKDKNGATPFHLALVIPAEESVLLALLDHYPNVCKVEDEHGMIPLHYVAAFMNTPISVVRKMVEIYQYGSCHISRSGDTPLHILVRNSADDVSLFDSNEGVKNKLLDRNGIEILQLLMGNTELSSKQHGKDLNKEYDPYFITNNESVSAYSLFYFLFTYVIILTYNFSYFDGFQVDSCTLLRIV